MTRAGPRQLPRTRGTALGWLGACVLLVLLASSGLAADRVPLPLTHTVETIERPAARAAAVAIREVEPPAMLRAANERVRPLPRTRSVASRGLPPARAPTA